MTMPTLREPVYPVLLSNIIVIGLVVGELLALSLLYQHSFTFTCRDVLPDGFCAFAGRIVPRVLAVLAGLLLFSFAYRRDIARLFSAPAALGAGLGLNLLGFAFILAPWFVLNDDSGQGIIAAGAVSWIGGGLLAAVGIALILAPVQAWSSLFRTHWQTLSVILVMGMAMPEIGDQLMPLWRIEAVTEGTFSLVIAVLTLIGYEVLSDAPTKAIGTQDWAVLVGPQCSGVEGFLLITLFLTLYIALFRRELRFPNILVLYPIGILLSGAFNVLRISVLIMIGLEGHEDLAVGAFHSHAGWLAFTTLALLFIFVSRTVPWFNAVSVAQETKVAGPPRFLQDPMVVQILPFIVFMASALVVSTLSASPGVHYPWRALAMGAVLALIWPALRALPWRIDPVSVAVGALIGAGWIITGPDAGDPPFGALAGGALALWFVARIVGTTLFVPILEELFFRKYLLDKLAPSGTGWRMVLAVVVTSGLFALLHDRWIEAGIAGLLFAGLVWRSRNVTDAILAHAVANGMIAAWAFAFGAWHII